MRIFICGKIDIKIRGKFSRETKEEYGEAYDMLTQKGFYAFNPCVESWQNALLKQYDVDRQRQPHGNKLDIISYILLRNLMVLGTCDGIYLLENWKDSHVSKMEYLFAKETGMRIMFEARNHAGIFLWEEYWKLVRAGAPPLQRMEGEADYDMARRYEHLHIEDVWFPIG